MGSQKAVRNVETVLELVTLMRQAALQELQGVDELKTAFRYVCHDDEDKPLKQHIEQYVR